MPHKNIARAASSRLTHLTTEDAQNAPDVVYNMFIVHGATTSALFDLGATYSYISTKFAREHSIPVTPRKEPIDTSSPLGHIICIKRCQGVSIIIEGHPFLANLPCFPLMDWMSYLWGY
jgi:hypothetical protein